MNRQLKLFESKKFVILNLSNNFDTSFRFL